MFESKDSLNYYRKEGSISRTIEVTLEAKSTEHGEEEKLTKKANKKKEIMIGASVLSEHVKKEEKMTAIRKFLSSKNPMCCSRGPDDPCGCNGKLCFGVFEDCVEQETAIENLRLKYFSPRVSQKDRRGVLLQELQSMLQVNTIGVSCVLYS